MKILSINISHDSSVTVMSDSNIESYLKEERFSRKKRDDFPWLSLFTALKNNPDIDYTIISGGGGGMNHSSLLSFIQKNTKSEIINYVSDHHLSHASLAFYNSGFDKALCVIIDRWGAAVDEALVEAETVFLASYPCNFHPLQKNLWAHKDHANFPVALEKAKTKVNYYVDNFMSITKVYETASNLSAIHNLENGKTMGLSSYGNPNDKFVKFFKDGHPDESLFYEAPFVYGKFSPPFFREYLDKVIKYPNEITKDNYQFYADYAYQVQQQTQEEVLRLVKKHVAETGIKKVCLAGGYALNVVCNGYLLKQLPDVEFYFEPLADDSGISLGSAIHFYRSKTNDISKKKLTHTFLHGVPRKLNDIGTPCTVTTIAKFLTEQKTVAVYNGLAEAGPRALGNRSILFDARNPDAKDIVNRIKKREWYRPFAGMILEEYFQEYFETYGILNSEFMTVSFDTKRSKDIPGVVHVDNSCRVQTVSKNIPHIYDLLEIFRQMTGCPVLLNTSFNLAGEALIETQDEAINCFNNSEIDVLWFPELNKCLKK